MSWLKRLLTIPTLRKKRSHTRTGTLSLGRDESFIQSLLSEVVPHRRYKGSTGSGKTNAATLHLLEFALRGDYWITAVFPHPQWGEKLIAELYCLLGEELFDRLIVERLSDTDRIIPRQFLYSSKAEDPYQRMMENDEYRQAFVDILLPMQEKTTLGDQPSKAENLDLAIAVQQNLDVFSPESWMHHLLAFRHPVNTFAKRHLPEEQKLALESLDGLDAKARQMGPGSACRLLRPTMGSPVMQVRTCMPEYFDWTRFKNKAGIHVILGGNVSKDAIRVHVGSDFQRTVRSAKRRELNPGIYFKDEATNYGLYGNFESEALSTIRAFGVSMWHAIQSENYATPEIVRNVAQNVEDWIFLQLDPDEALRAARTLNGRRDPYEVHHEDVTIRSVETGEYDKKIRKGISKGKNGITETESEQLIPIRRDEELKTKRFNPLQAQTEEQADRLMQFRPGQCAVNERGRAPYETQVDLFPDSWAFSGLAEAKATECIQAIKQRAPYETPVMVPFPVEETTSSSGSKGQTKPSRNLPKPRGRHGS